jgi:serine/threonine-protein kinase
MGEVWRAEHRLLARPAAIKLIQGKALAHSEESAEGTLLRFEREAQATALLASEHTIEVYDFGIATNGMLYYVMELLDGLDLEQLVKTWGPMPPERVVHCLIQACDSLAEAHENGLVHRDIKPSNIFLCRRGLKHDVVKVLDFGLVKVTSDHLVSSQTLTAQQAVGGTPAYMVPEIIEDAGAIDGRADLYALGCVAYYCLSGRLVFEATRPMQMVMKHLSASPQPLSQRAEQAIPPALEQIVHACLEKDPARRPPSALELGERLAAVALEPAWTEQSARAWWQQHRAPSSEAPVDPTGDTLLDTRSLGEPQTSASSLADTVAQRPGKRSD